MLVLLLLSNFLSNAQNEKTSEIIIGSDTFKVYPILLPKEEPIDYSGMDFLFFPDSLSDGNWVQFYIGEDSLVAKKGKYSNFVKHGDFLSYDISGNLFESASYEQGRLRQKSTYYPNGVLRTREEYSEEGGFLVYEAWSENKLIKVRRIPGLYQEWYDNGQKRVEKPSVNRKLDGEVTIWFSNGDIMYQAEWDQGKQIGKAQYSKRPGGKSKCLNYKKLPNKVLKELRGY